MTSFSELIHSRCEVDLIEHRLDPFKGTSCYVILNKQKETIFAKEESPESGKFSRFQIRSVFFCKSGSVNR